MNFSNYNTKSSQYADYWDKLLGNAIKRKEQVIWNMKIIAYFVYIYIFLLFIYLFIYLFI